MPAKRKKLTDAELIAACEAKVRDAVTFDGGTLSSDRSENLKYYRGEPFGNEVTGRSQVVTRDVAEAIDSLMPELVEIFVASDRPVLFQPHGPEDVPEAEQATDYVNWIWRNRGGLKLLYTWLKDGLLNKRGVVKVWWEESEERVPENYEGLTQEQLSLLATDADLEIAEVAQGMDPEAQVPIFDVKAWRTRKSGNIHMAPVPLDEFLIDRNAVDEWEAPFIGTRTKKNKTELKDLGFPASVIDDLSDTEDNEVELSGERVDRFSDDGTDSLPREPADDTVEEVWVKDIFIKVDADGDGKAEYRHVIYAGNHVLVNEEADDHFFATWCPHLIPHKFWGQSIADQTKDIQLIKSTILRQILDNLYLANNPEKAVVEGAVNVEDLLVSRPGGIKRMRAPGMIENFEYPFVAGQSFPVIEWLDQNLERRTGAFRYNQGLDPNAINKTATGVTKLMAAGERRVRLMARIFAETGLTRLFRLILKLVQKHQKVSRIVQLRGQWVPMDPRNWRTDRNTAIDVGLGTGNKDALIAHIGGLLQLDAQIIQMQGGMGGPLLKASNVYNKLAKLVEAIGLKPAEMYYAPPPEEADQPGEPRPDPQMAKVQGELAIEQAKAQAELQRKQVEMEAKLALEREKAALELQLRREEHALEMRMREEEMRIKMQMEAAELKAEILLKNKQIEQQGAANANVRDPDNPKKAA